MSLLGTRNLGTVGHHTVTATTTKIAPGMFYTQTGCTCERSAPITGSFYQGCEWAREHLAAIVPHSEQA